MSNIATTIEQSKELLRLGLSAESANMHYVRKVTDFMGNKIENPKWSVPKYGNPDSKHANYIVQNFTEFEVLPAWSLSALLEVMPKVIVHDMNKHVLCLKYAEGVAPFMYYVVESGRNKGKLIRFDNGRCVPDAYDALDAAYQMVCWLLEQGLIKK